MKVHLLTVGDEILIGQIVDTNSAWMGQQLNLAGAEVVEISSVGDEKTGILAGIRHAFSNADLVLMTGGLGPTKDDITKVALAEFFDVEMVFDQPTYERIVRMFEMLGRPTSEAHKQQSYMPSNALILKNKMGTAPGMWFEYGEKVLVSMPGVPYEMKWIMENEVLPRLKTRFPSSPIAHRTIRTAGSGESQLASILESFEDHLPPFIKLAYLPSPANVKLRLTGRNKDEKILHEVLDEKKSELLEIVKDYAYGFEEETLEAVIGNILKEKKLSLATAESCTGGYLAHLITSVPGSSAYYKGSIIAYANEVKIRELGVAEQTLETHGAVSEETVTEMVRGALKVLNTDLAVATSGIAGPDGGTPEKPVGTIWIAVGSEEKIITHKLQLGKERMRNIEYTATFALHLLYRFIIS